MKISMAAVAALFSLFACGTAMASGKIQTSVEYKPSLDLVSPKVGVSVYQHLKGVAYYNSYTGIGCDISDGKLVESCKVMDISTKQGLDFNINRVQVGGALGVATQTGHEDLSLTPSISGKIAVQLW